MDIYNDPDIWANKKLPRKDGECEYDYRGRKRLKKEVRSLQYHYKMLWPSSHLGTYDKAMKQFNKQSNGRGVFDHKNNNPLANADIKLPNTGGDGMERSAADTMGGR